MGVGQMMTHCTDQLQIVLGEKHAKPVGNSVLQWLMKWFGLNVPLQLPKNMRTIAELDPNKSLMTQPVDFAKDRNALLSAIARMENLPHNQRLAHPVFGSLTKEEAIKLTHIHLDHHLRQFGV
jgi:Protein of unknown function (DUF1569)